MSENNLARIRQLNQELEEDLTPEIMMRALIEMMCDGMAIVGDDFKIKCCTDSFASVFGYSLEELTDQPVSLLIPQRKQEIHHQNMMDWYVSPRVLRMDRKGRGNEIIGLRKDGTEINLNIGVIPMSGGKAFIILNQPEQTHLEKEVKESDQREPVNERQERGSKSP